MERSETQGLLNQLQFYQNSSQLKEKAWEVLEEQVARAAQTRSILACILLDIDHFCLLVETAGQALGESILLGCLNGLQDNPVTYQAMSYGRDEFIIIAPARGIEDATFLAESLRRKVAEVVSRETGSLLTNLSFSVGCSAGIALYPIHAGEATTLLGKAEEGLYLAKRQGRNMTRLPSDESMILKSNYYSRIQLERLAALATRTGRSEASLLREALDRLLTDSDI
jgi:diguanylate cyclase (GGDEF)-like protein